MYCCIGIAFNCYCIIEHANITMCRIEHMYYREGISSVIIDEITNTSISSIPTTFDEIRILLSIMQDSDEKC